MTPRSASGARASIARAPSVTTVESLDDLVACFSRAARSRASDWRVGTEHEKIGLSRDDSRAACPSRARAASRGCSQRVAEAGRLDAASTRAGTSIALEKDGASITLEPGGQLELSGAPLRTIHETCERVPARTSR